MKEYLKSIGDRLVMFIVGILLLIAFLAAVAIIAPLALVAWPVLCIFAPANSIDLSWGSKDESEIIQD